MKNLIILLFLAVFTSSNFSAQEYIKISALNITQINESQIKANLKIEELFGTTVYNSHTTEVSGNVITLKVCYDIYTFDGGQIIENDFFLDIPSNPGNYTFNVEIYAWGSNGCFQIQNMEDSASLNYTNPFTGTITLSATDFVSKDKNIKLYPNPVKDLLNFSEEISNVKITDFSGKMVKEFRVGGKSIDVSKLAVGNYIIEITSKTGEVTTRKLIKK